jgi:hypothetical protein
MMVLRHGMTPLLWASSSASRRRSPCTSAAGTLGAPRMRPLSASLHLTVVASAAARRATCGLT